jgi:hypothetical protein
MSRATARLCLLALLAAALSPAPLYAQPKETEAGLVAKGGKRLGAADFAARYIGNTLTGTTADGEAFHVFVASAQAYRMEFQGKRSADRWHAGKDGEFCAAAGSEVTCTREYALSDTIYSFNADGSLAGTARIRSGNPEKL